MNQPAASQPAVYYVTYGRPGQLGAMDVPAPHQIASIQDLQALIAEVKRVNGADTVVLNYQLINPPATVDTAHIAGLVSAAQHDLAAGTPPKTILTNLLAELYKISR